MFNDKLSKRQRLAAAMFCAKLETDAHPKLALASANLLDSNSIELVQLTNAIQLARTAAHRAIKNAYAPYSNFHVGASIITQSLNVFGGCNVENASYGLTICAERNAVGAAVAAADTDVLFVLVHTNTPAPVWPCGACRQVLMEFGSQAICIGIDAQGTEAWLPLELLLPNSFNSESLTQ